MAKAARTPEVTEAVVDRFVSDILDKFANIESARGSFMNVARREREKMVSIYENMATRHGVSQKAAKTEIKIVRAMQQIKGWIADLEAEDRKMVERMARLQKDRKQLLLFGELPKAPKPSRKKSNVVPLKTDLESTPPQGIA